MKTATLSRSTYSNHIGISKVGSMEVDSMTDSSSFSPSSAEGDHSPIYNKSGFDHSGKQASNIEFNQSQNDAVTERILMALSGGRADDVVPHAGKPDILKAVFIKSTDDLGSKLAIIQDSFQEESFSIVKSASIEDADLSMKQDHVGDVPSNTVNPTATKTPISAQVASGLKTPQDIRKFQFHGLFSFFYSNSSSREMGDLSPSTNTAEEKDLMDNAHENKWAMLKKQPAKGILRPTKALGDMSGLPPPIQKSAFLRQEEITRLTRFTQSYRYRSRESVSIDDHMMDAGKGQLMYGPQTGHILKAKAINQASSMPQLSRGRRLQFTLERSTTHETWHRTDYERGGVDYIAKNLTPEIANMIKKELNEVKREMLVHEDSKHYTQFYQVR